MRKFLEVGKVLRTHGVSGVVKLEHWCDSCEVFKHFKFLYLDSGGTTKLRVKFLKFANNFVLLGFCEFDDMEKARELVGRVLYASRSDFRLLPGKSFVKDLIGCVVVDSLNSDVIYGVVEEVLNYGASDIYKIRDESGRDFLIPVVDEIVRGKDLEKKVIFIEPMEGLFDV